MAWQPTPVLLPGESPWSKEPGGLKFTGLQRVGHDWATTYSIAHVCHSFSSKEPVSLNFTAAVTVHSDFGAHENTVCYCINCFPICHEVMRPDAMTLVFWMLSFKPAFSALKKKSHLSSSPRDSLVTLHFLPLGIKSSVLFPSQFVLSTCKTSFYFMTLEFLLHDYKVPNCILVLSFWNPSISMWLLNNHFKFSISKIKLLILTLSM